MLKKSILGLLAVGCLISVLVLVACNRSPKQIATAQPTTSETTTTPDTPAAITPIVWSPGIDCSVCHVMQSYVDSLQDPSLIVYIHAPKGFGCLDCHEQEILEEVHGDVNSNATSIEERKFPMEYCFRCHGSYADLIELTKDSEALTVIADEAVNPHDSHEGEVDCYYCHKMHKKVEPKDYCYDCH